MAEPSNTTASGLHEHCSKDNWAYMQSNRQLVSPLAPKDTLGWCSDKSTLSNVAPPQRLNTHVQTQPLSPSTDLSAPIIYGGFEAHAHVPLPSRRPTRDTVPHTSWNQLAVCQPPSTQQAVVHRKLIGLSCPLVLPGPKHGQGSFQEKGKASSASSQSLLVDKRTRSSSVDVTMMDLQHSERCRVSKELPSKQWQTEEESSRCDRPVACGNPTYTVPAGKALEKSPHLRSTSVEPPSSSASPTGFNQPPWPSHMQGVRSASRFSQDVGALNGLPYSYAALAGGFAAHGHHGCHPMHHAAASGHGFYGHLPASDSIVCLVPGVCEIAVAMGLSHRLAGVSNDCYHPQDVCSGVPVFAYTIPSPKPAASGPQGGMNKNTSQAQQAAWSMSCAAPQQQQRTLWLDENAFRRAQPSVVILPALSTLSPQEREHIQQVVVHAGLLDPARGTPPATLLHYSVHSLVDILDFIHQLGESTGEQQAATALVDRLQARMRRIAMDAARLVASTPCSTGGSSMRTSAAALAAGLGSTSSTATVVSAAACGTRGSGRPRVLVLEALAPTPTVAGRWAPALVELAGGTALLQAPSSLTPGSIPRVNSTMITTTTGAVTKSAPTDPHTPAPGRQLTWEEVRALAPDVLILCTSTSQALARVDDSGSLATGPVPTRESLLSGQGQGQSTAQGQGHWDEPGLEQLAAQPGFWCLPALKTGQLYLMQRDYLTVPGLGLFEGLEMISWILAQCMQHGSMPAGMPDRQHAGQQAQAALARRVLGQHAGALWKLSLPEGERCRPSALPGYFQPLV